MKKSILLLLAALVFSVSADRPKIALYAVNDELTEREANVLSAQFLRMFTRSGMYDVIDRSDLFTDRAAEERIKQMDGSVDDAQIFRIGREAGATHVCMIGVDAVPGAGYRVSARMVDVETAELFLSQGVAAIPSLDCISEAVSEVFRQMHGNRPQAIAGACAAKARRTESERLAAERRAERAQRDRENRNATGETH